MKWVLVMSLLAAAVIAAPSRKIYPDPHPNYYAEPEVKTYETDAPLWSSQELTPIRNYEKKPVVDDKGNVYIPMITPNEDVEYNVFRALQKYRDVKISQPDGPIYLYLISTTHDSKYKRYIYCDEAINLYMKV